jgi:ABC-type amino acid transport substrate-binding protein
MNRGRLVLTVVSMAVLTTLLLGACAATAPTPTPTVPPPAATATLASAPTQAKPAPTATVTGTVPAAGDGAWERIQKSGVMVVGTSADYPPFEYLNDKFQIDGFDPALIREIGKQLGVQVEIKNFAFDGLYNALQLGQVDAVIAAVSITPEREKVVDLSNPYYVGEDALLATDKSQLSIKTVDELARLKIGAQRGSVYETFLQDTLVDTRKMPQRNLFSFTDTSQAIAALKSGRIDVVVLDAGPANAFMREGGLKIVGSSLLPQYYGIAVPLGAEVLRNNINKSLALLQADGTVAKLLLQYTGNKPDPALPTPTPRPTSTPRPVVVATPTPSSCIDGMAWVADLSYDDKNMTAPPVVQPGQPFKKGWRVKNTGTCTWSTAYKLVYAYGNTPAASMSGQPAPVMQPVPPGGTYDFYVNLVAPLQPGVYQGFWQMQNAAGQSFGQTVYVGIQVPAAPQPTAAPTRTPAPGISFTVDRTTINAGECVTFSWNVTNVKAVYFYPDGTTNWQNYGVAGQGSSVQCPTHTTTYNLQVVYTNNTTQISQITINVNQTTAPLIAYFNVNPMQIGAGQCVNIQWDVQGATNKVVITRGGTAIWDNAPTRGNMDDCPPGSGTAPYVLTATGPGGTSKQQRDVSVAAQPPTAVPPTGVPPTAVPPTAVPPTPAPQPPVINSFSVQPDRIQSGQCVQIQWATGGGTEWVRLTRNGAVVLDRAGPSGSLQDCLTEPTTFIYRLEAFNHAGQATAQERTVTVQAPPTPAPPQAPVIKSFNASAKDITVGQCVVLSWEFSGATATTLLKRNNDVIAQDFPSPGSHQDCPPAPGGITYLLIVSSEQSSANAAQSVMVYAAVPAPAPAPLPAPVPAAK